MNQKEINELRRRFRPEKSAISRVYGCYVNSSKEIVSDLDESLGMMPQEESEKYLSLLKKGLSGSLGKNLIDIVFSTQQVADSEEHRLLTTLWDSQLKDNEARQTFYHKVLNRAGLQPLRDIRTGADLTGSAAVMQAVPAIHILRLVAEAAEDHHPAAALLEARDAHHHMLQTSSRGILSEISCHGTLLLSKQKSGSCLCCTVCADAAPAFSDVTYQFVAPVLVPAPVCPPDLGQCIRSLSLRSAWL